METIILVTIAIITLIYIIQPPEDTRDTLQSIQRTGRMNRESSDIDIRMVTYAELVNLAFKNDFDINDNIITDKIENKTYSIDEITGKEIHQYRHEHPLTQFDIPQIKLILRKRAIIRGLHKSERYIRLKFEKSGLMIWNSGTGKTSYKE